MSKISLNRRAFVVGGLASLLSGPVFAQTNKTGFIFVGASWCPICHRAAPFLDGVAQRLGVPVLVASADNKPISPFPNFVDASEHPIARQVTNYPTTLLYSSETQGLVGKIVGYRDPKRYIAQLVSAYRQIEEGSES